MSGCTRSSNEGSKHRPCCRLQILPLCCSGRCLPQARSICAKSMAGRRSQQSPSISQLTSQPETIPSCDRRTRRPKFQPHRRRHQSIGELLLLGEALAEHCWTGHPRAPAESDWAARSASTVRIRSIDGDAGNRATASMRRSSRTCRPGDGFNCLAAAG